MELAKRYRQECKDRHSIWDTNGNYGFKSIFQPIGYWRKANQIHYWFVKHIQNGVDDCGCYIIAKEKIEELLDICEKIKACSVLENGVIINSEIAKELLPCEDGFFFGDNEYDEYYYENIKSTICILKKVLEETDFVTEMVFYSSSW